MKIHHILKSLVFSFLFAFIVQNAAADSFRVKKVHLVNTTNDISKTGESVKLGINEAISISIPEDRSFIQGLVIKFEIPEALASWRDSVACTVYSSISPKPAANKIDYSGTRAYVQTLPGRLSWILQIPFEENIELKTNQYTTTADTIPDLNDNLIFIRLQSVMKGIPEEALNASISATVQPIFSNKGRLIVDLKTDEDNIMPCSIFVDDNAVSLNSDKNHSISSELLDTGIHNISIISEYYRNEVRTARIDRAKDTKLEITMKSIEPTIVLTAPEGASIFFDEEPFTRVGEEVLISEGEHKVKLILGDYEIVKNLQILKGKTYKINLSVDLQISEE